MFFFVIVCEGLFVIKKFKVKGGVKSKKKSVNRTTHHIGILPNEFITIKIKNIYIKKSLARGRRGLLEVGRQ